ncbi:MAG: DUF4328 domain-containing protein, partial [Ilumatobacteraceae bacterium]
QGVPEPHPAPPPPPPPPPSLTPPPPPPFPGAMAPPPGYVSYGASAGGEFKRVRGVGKALVALEAAGVALTLLALGFQSALAGPAQDFLDGAISQAAFDDEASSYRRLAGLSTLVTLAALVVGIIWSYRIASNLRSLGRTITWKPGLTIAVWILGFCTLGIVNFLMFKEHWKASDPDVRPGDPSWTQRPSLPIITAWLALTLLSAGVQIAMGVATGRRALNGFNGTDSARTLAETAANDLPLLAASGLLGAASTVVLIGIVRQLTQRHAQATIES